MPDYSCTVTLANTSQFPLYLQSNKIVDGYFTTSPPDTVKAGQTVQWRLADKAGAVGSEAFTYYQAGVPNGAVNLTFHYSCPVWSQNIFTGNSSNTRIVSVTASGVSGSGHPVNGTFTITNSMFEAHGLAGIMPPALMKKFEGADVAHEDSAPVWKEVHEHLGKMKDAETWTVGS